MSKTLTVGHPNELSWWSEGLLEEVKEGSKSPALLPFSGGALGTWHPSNPSLIYHQPTPRRQVEKRAT